MPISDSALTAYKILEGLSGITWLTCASLAILNSPDWRPYSHQLG